ncbi:hypothetical protein L6452_08013 [Arctium lappa]|uniref:Uncharacterized protein n=1 Tax=Arctium lappa TaxID=4217 RepID=A0ACB9DGC4_ARCLA|nr:hypothetical protein L6452_08013 [Arctium lappa]
MGEETEAADTQISRLSITEVEGRDENTLIFLDSVDNYLILIETLSSTLRQGWLELASARHSMGASRVNSALLSLKQHSAATTVELDYDNGTSLLPPFPPPPPPSYFYSLVLVVVVVMWIMFLPKLP